MYTFESRVRFSEIDHTQLMTLPALVNYFQDCSILQSEDLGVGIDALKARKKAWMLSGWQIEVKRYPKLGEAIKVSTWATGFEGLFGFRNFMIEDEAGQMIACANSNWIYMDLGKGRPVKPKEEDIGMYEIGDPIPMEEVSRKIKRAEDAKEMEPIAVRKDQIDTNEHVNNCQYLHMAQESFPVCERPGKLRVEYKKSAVLGDMIYPKAAKEEERTVVELCDEKGTLYAIIEYKENE